MWEVVEFVPIEPGGKSTPSRRLSRGNPNASIHWAQGLSRCMPKARSIGRCILL